MKKVLFKILDYLEVLLFPYSMNIEQLEDDHFILFNEKELYYIEHEAYQYLELAAMINISEKLLSSLFMEYVISYDERT